MVSLLDVLKNGAEFAPNVMDGPNSDWIPVLMFEDPEGHVVNVAIPNMTPANLQETADAVRDILREHGAVQAALVLPTWFTTLNGDGAARTERVLVTHVDRQSTQCEAAKVIRSGADKPRLSRWDVYAADIDVGPGMFVDAMRAAIA